MPRSLTLRRVAARSRAFRHDDAGLFSSSSAAVDSAFQRRLQLGLDGISLPLDGAHGLHDHAGRNRRVEGDRGPAAQYFAAFLIMEGLMIGVFSSLDALLFYFFWEAMLIPMFLIIGIWGGPRRVYATIKFFLYTFLGSVFMLVALIYMYLKAGDYSVASFQALPLTLNEQTLDFPCVPARVRRQSAHVAGAHVASRRARRGADRWFGDPGGDHAEDGRLRLPALQPADRARCLPRARHG